MKHTFSSLAFAPALVLVACGAPNDDAESASEVGGATSADITRAADASPEVSDAKSNEQLRAATADTDVAAQRELLKGNTLVENEDADVRGEDDVDPYAETQRHPKLVPQGAGDTDEQAPDEAVEVNDAQREEDTVGDEVGDGPAEAQTDLGEAADKVAAAERANADLNDTEADPAADAAADAEGLVPGASLATPLASDAADNPYACIKEQVVDAALCGTETVRDGTLCGTETVRDATLCGTMIVTDAALCGTTIVTDAALCGVQTVTSGALCGTRTVTDGVLCGWDFLGSIFSGKSPSTCQVDASCDVPASCEIAATCEVAAECTIDSSCELPKSCELQRCSQTFPGGACLPGLAECDVEGFACQVSVDSDVFRCLPSYSSDLDVQDRALCDSFFDANVSALAAEGRSALSFSTGTAGTAVASGSYEVGTVYGAEGEFGCFVSSCVGVQSDLSVAQFANFGAYTAWDVFAGNAKTFSVGGSLPVIELGISSASVVSSDYESYLGQVDSVSIGVGVLPVNAAHMSCNTTVYQTR
jgi:hypothetical protein